MPIIFDNLPSALPFIKDGRLIPIVVAAPQRLAVLPNVPTFKEVGLEPVNRMAYYGVLAPKGTPKDVVDKIHAAAKKALDDPGVRKRIEDTGSLIVGNTPEQFAAQIKAEFAVYKKVVAQQKLDAGCSAAALIAPEATCGWLSRPWPSLPRSIDRFIDALWIEDGLAANTLAAYRRDLTLYAHWLAGATGRARSRPDRDRPAGLRGGAPRRQQGHHREPPPDGLQALLPLGAARAPRAAPTRRSKLLAARQPLRVPKTLSEAQVEALLAAPDVDTPLGLRDRTMLELMYASGLRVSELVTLKTVHLGLTEGALRVTGKGAKERLVPFGEEAHVWLERYLADGARARSCRARRATRSSSPRAAAR